MPPPASTDETLPLLPGEVLDNKYRIERVLGRGGMGFVVAARNIALGKRVAIKMMLPAALGRPQAVERFEREARAAVQLKSEHVAQVLDIDKLPTGEPYIVMELLDGSDFEAVLRRERWLSIEDAVDYLLQTCEAVAEAHALGVVHRDLKPRNMFLSHRLDGSPVVKVLDFGISKWTVDQDSHGLTGTSDVLGSPNYMSPEQIRSSRDVDGRTDIWSLGIILFELLSGRVPFLAENMPQLCALVLETQAPLVSTLRADVPPELVAIVARCLERAAERRFQTVDELAVALRPFGPAKAMRTTGSSRNANLSPSASTIATARTGASSQVVGHDATQALGSGPTLAITPLVAASRSSAAGPHILSSNTSASWVNAPSPKRAGSRWLAALAAVPVFVVASVVWAGVHWRGVLGHAPTDDAGVATLAPSPTSPISPMPTGSAPTAASALPATSASAAPSASVVSTDTSPSASTSAAVNTAVRTVPPPRSKTQTPPRASVGAAGHAVPPTRPDESLTPDERK